LLNYCNGEFKQIPENVWLKENVALNCLYDKNINKCWKARYYSERKCLVNKNLPARKGIRDENQSS
jgi:hypothetical protein